MPAMEAIYLITPNQNSVRCLMGDFQVSYFHVLSCTFMYFHVLSCTFMYFHVLSCTFMYFHVLSCTSATIRLGQIDSSTIDGNEEFVHFLYSYATSVNSVFVADKIINNSNNFRIKCNFMSSLVSVLHFFI